jgi:hypothetical protein
MDVYEKALAKQRAADADKNRRLEAGYKVALRKQQAREAPRLKELDKAYARALDRQRKANRPKKGFDWLKIGLVAIAASIAVYLVKGLL